MGVIARIVGTVADTYTLVGTLYNIVNGTTDTLIVSSNPVLVTDTYNEDIISEVKILVKFTLATTKVAYINSYNNYSVPVSFPIGLSIMPLLNPNTVYALLFSSSDGAANYIRLALVITSK